MQHPVVVWLQHRNVAGEPTAVALFWGVPKFCEAAEYIGGAPYLSQPDGQSHQPRARYAGSATTSDNEKLHQRDSKHIGLF